MRPHLPAPAGGHTAGLPRPVQLLNVTFVQTDGSLTGSRQSAAGGIIVARNANV